MTTTAPLKALLALSLSALLLACEQPNWGDPNYVAQQLEQGDASARAVAMDKLELLEDDQRRVAVPVLTKLYLADDEDKKKQMEILLELRDERAKDAYLKEVESDATEQGGAAAEVLGEIKARDAIDAIAKLYQSTDSDMIKQGILRGFAYMPDEKMVPLLVETLKLDVDNNPIALHTYSCEILGDIVQQNPDALDEEGRRVLIRSIFLANNTNQNTGTACGLATQQLGAPAVPILFETFKLENEAVQKLMMKYGFPSNQPKAAAATRLGTLRAKEAAPLLIEDLPKARALPEALLSSRDASMAWLTMEGQALSEAILTLGDLGAMEAKPVLLEVVRGEHEESWAEIKNAVGLLVFVQLRQDAAKALNALGDREAAEELFKGAQDMKSFEPLVENVKAVAAHNKTPLPSAAELYSYNVTLAQAYANLAESDKKEAFEEWVKGVEDAPLRAELEKFIPAFDLHAECAAKGDIKAQAACYGAKVEEPNAALHQKAIFELQRLPSEVAAPIIAEKLSTENLAARELLTSAAYKHPSQAALDQVNATLEAEASRGGPNYSRDRTRLKYLSAWLANHV